MCTCVVCTQSQFTCWNFLSPSQTGLFSSWRSLRYNRDFIRGILWEQSLVWEVLSNENRELPVLGSWGEPGTCECSRAPHSCFSLVIFLLLNGRLQTQSWKNLWAWTASPDSFSVGAVWLWVSWFLYSFFTFENIFKKFMFCCGLSKIWRIYF